MKYLFMTVFLLASLKLLAPYNERSVVIFIPDEITRYESLIKAVVRVESNGDNFAINVKEQAIGAFQIRQCRIEHFNQLSGKNYKLEEMFDYSKAREVFLFFAKRLKDNERIAKRWNGSGPMTEVYWNKVKKLL